MNNYFKDKPDPKSWSLLVAVYGHKWLKGISPESRQAFSWIGRQAANHGKTGGLARARTSRRDDRGRFISNTAVN